MAILKPTSTSDNTVVTNSDMHRGLQEKFYKESLALAADLVIDIEAIYHDCFRGGLNQIDHNIIHRCKHLLGETLNELGLFNVNLHADINQAINQAATSQEIEAKRLRDLAIAEAKRTNSPLPPEPRVANRFICLESHPRVKLDFKPRGKNSVDESDESLNSSNEHVSKTVAEINEIIGQLDPSSGNAVRRKYTQPEDGYLITISFGDLTSVDQVLNRLSSFINTIESLSLDELMISQQFSNWFNVKQVNPFDLESADIDELTQSIVISVFNLEEFTASFYVSAMLNNTKIQISNAVSGSEKLSIKENKASINSSFLCINLQF